MAPAVHVHKPKPLPSFPAVDDEDVNSMPVALQMAIDSLARPEEAAAECTDLLAKRALRPLPASRRPWLPDGAYAMHLGPKKAAAMTPRARQALVWLLWLLDFKWVTWSSGGFGTHVHFGYNGPYGGRPRDPKKYARMSLGPDAVLRFGPGLPSKLVTAIEFPCDIRSSYIGVRTTLES